MDPTASQAFIWHELMSGDPDSSERFYKSVARLRVQRRVTAPVHTACCSQAIVLSVA